jgi:ABC-type branched-subunit amino acid transport system permease subunit
MRRLFQLHLSSCLILVVLAAVLNWAIVHERCLGGGGAYNSVMHYAQGWPFDFSNRHVVYSDSTGLVSNWKISRSVQDGFSVGRLIANIMIALAILCAVAIFAEALVRKRAGQK